MFEKLTLKKIITVVLVMAAMVARQIKEKDPKQETKVSYLGYKFAYFAACLLKMSNIIFNSNAFEVGGRGPRFNTRTKE